MTIELETNELYKFINCIPGGIFAYIIKNQYPYLEITAWNKVMTEITGYSFEEIVEIGFISIISTEERELNLSGTFIHDLFNGAANIEKYVDIKTKENKRKTFSINLSSMNNEVNSDKCSFIALIKDVTIEKTNERALKEIDSKYRIMLESSKQAIFIYRDMKFVYLNQNALKMLEFENGVNPLGKPIIDYIHFDFHETLLNRVKDSYEREYNLYNIEEKFITSKGKVIDVEIQMTCIPYKGRRYNVVYVSDISEHKTMEKELKKSEEYFRKLFNNVNDAIYLNKLDEDGLPSVYIEVNNVACNRLGYSREELRGMTPYMTNPLIDPKKAKYLIEQITKQGNVIYEGVAKRKDGEVSPVEINSIFLELNNEKYILSISRDISERKKNDRFLKESEQRYRQLIEAIPYALYIRSNDRILFSNKVGLEYIGLSSSEDLKGKRFKDILRPHPAYEKEFRRNLELIKENGFMPLSEEKFIRLSDNKILDSESIVIKYDYDGNGDTYLVVTRDLSDRKKAEMLLNVMNEKTVLLEQATEYEKLRTEFFANISHELRTPVTVIFSTLQLLNMNISRMEEIDKNVQNFIKYNDIMKQNCYRLVRLINNLIDVTKIDSGYLDLNLVNANIVGIVEDITQSVAEYAVNKGISLIFDTTTEEKIIACDPDKIERIMLNLISNAIKFTPSGGKLFVNVMDKGSSIMISVKDTGIGIPEDQQKIIFDRFVQVDKSLTRKNEGSGIGLSLVKALVDMHKGNISVHSQANKGCEFLIELPVYLVDECTKDKINKEFYLQGNVEKINIEFSDIYF